MDDNPARRIPSFFRNTDDTVRARIYDMKDVGAEIAAGKEFGVDVFLKDPSDPSGFGMRDDIRDEMGDNFYSKVEALEWIKSEYGPMKGMRLPRSAESYTHGWPRPNPESAPVTEVDAGSGILFVTAPPQQTMLLLRRDDGFWSIPGGSIERGEDAKSASLREIDEEIGGMPKRYELLGNAVMGDEASGFTYTTFVVLVDGEFEPTLNEEHDDWGWYTSDGALSLDLHPGFTDLLGSVDPWSL